MYAAVQSTLVADSEQVMYVETAHKTMIGTAQVQLSCAAAVMQQLPLQQAEFVISMH